ncbi:DinB family protein [Cohnella rhizosphaerae]|uniref:DinB family protein n=1 Tax=Cohnella rhizosphaerae TaxID=1457232 RepID=A0A9X4QVF6_9BACL|nr:DinB family protein [Cohnella rhizosphaerae]MDG0813281.1 DinB family protein [Cohnella rhizosphaerae]
MSNHNADIEAFTGTYDGLTDAVRGMDVAALTWKPGPGKWSATEVLVHLADHLIVVSFRIREILSGSQARLPAFSQDTWVEGQYGNEAEAADVLEGFRALVAYNARLLRRLSSADWEKEAINAKGDRVTLADVVRGFAAHAKHHLGQIDRIKAAESAANGRRPTASAREGI